MAKVPGAIVVLDPGGLKGPPVNLPDIPSGGRGLVIDIPAPVVPVEKPVAPTPEDVDEDLTLLSDDFDEQSVIDAGRFSEIGEDDGITPITTPTIQHEDFDAQTGGDPIFLDGDIDKEGEAQIRAEQNQLFHSNGQEQIRGLEDERTKMLKENDQVYQYTFNEGGANYLLERRAEGDFLVGRVDNPNATRPAIPLGGFLDEETGEIRPVKPEVYRQGLQDAVNDPLGLLGFVGGSTTEADFDNAVGILERIPTTILALPSEIMLGSLRTVVNTLGPIVEEFNPEAVARAKKAIEDADKANQAAGVLPTGAQTTAEIFSFFLPATAVLKGAGLSATLANIVAFGLFESATNSGDDPNTASFLSEAVAFSEEIGEEETALEGSTLSLLAKPLLDFFSTDIGSSEETAAETRIRDTLNRFRNFGVGASIGALAEGFLKFLRPAKQRFAFEGEEGISFKGVPEAGSPRFEELLKFEEEVLEKVGVAQEAGGFNKVMIEGQGADAIFSVKATPSETRHFEELLGNQANREELLEEVPSFKLEDGRISIAEKDLAAFDKFNQGSVIADGVSSVPPRLRTGKIFDKLEAVNG